MATVRRYPSHIAAQEAALALRAAGVMATVVSDHDVLGATGLTSGFGSHAVIVNDDAALNTARRFLDELESHPLSADPEWEDTAAAPDLGALPPSIHVACPSCRRAFHPADGPSACPHCGAPTDTVQLVIDGFGPEALAGCYPEPEATIDDDIVDAAPVVCRDCRYPLAGLPQESHCPECGRAYSKRHMLGG